MKHRKRKSKQQVNHKKQQKTEPVGSLGKVLQKAFKKQPNKPKESANSGSADGKKQKNTPAQPVTKTVSNVNEQQSWGKPPSTEKNNSSLPVISPANNSENNRSSSQNFECCYQTQIENSSQSSEESTLVIGLDFGTSCTKAIIRDNALQKSYAIPFDDETPYLISTTLFINNDGICGLVSGLVTGDEQIDDIKIDLMNNPDKTKITNKISGGTANSKCLATAYIALILREIRGWFIQEHRGKYLDKKLMWELNLGLPSINYDEDSCNPFKIIALAGWNLSVQRETVSINLAESALQNATKVSTDQTIVINEPQIHPENVNVFPEVIAEAIGYEKSSLQREGLHLLIDIGASTVDITSFIINTITDNRFNLLVTKVELYGAFRLHNNRSEKIRDFQEQKLRELSCSINGMTPIPEIAKYVVEKGEIEAIDREFIQQFRQILNDVVVKTRQDRDPRSSHWTDGLPVFLCGGGAQIEIYKQSVIKCFERFEQHSSETRFNIVDIPKPVEIEAPELAKKDYHRIAVAHGLSFSIDDIGKIVPPSDIMDIPNNNPRDYTDNYIGSEVT